MVYGLFFLFLSVYNMWIFMLSVRDLYTFCNNQMHTNMQTVTYIHISIYILFDMVIYSN